MESRETSCGRTLWNILFDMQAENTREGDGEQVHRGTDGKLRSAKQHDHYRWRGPVLILLWNIPIHEYPVVMFNKAEV